MRILKRQQTSFFCLFYLLCLATTWTSVNASHKELQNGNDADDFDPRHRAMDESGEILRGIFGDVLKNMLSSAHGLDGERNLRGVEGKRNLRGETGDVYECNAVVQTLSPKGLGDFMMSVLGDYGVTERWQQFGVQALLTTRMNYGIQVWKVCGRCSDFPEPGTVGCREEDYGYNALHSGLLFVPYNFEEGRILEGTRPTTVIATAGGFVPSLSWGETIEDPHLLIAAYITSSSRAYVLAPDNIGFAESKDYYRSFLIAQSTITGFTPLLWQSEDIVSKETNCSSAIGDDFTTLGYSEGGYGSVVIAGALDRMGKNVLLAQAGGGPYRISSTTIDDAIQKLRVGWYEISFFIGLLGASYSNSTKDASNFGSGQDFFSSPKISDAIVNAAQIDNRNERRGIYSIIPREDPLSVLNQDLVALYDAGRERGEPEPCKTMPNSHTDKICKALIEQDLIETMETATFPIWLCHSSTDQLVPFENLPNISANERYLSLLAVTGRHSPAAAPCLLDALGYFFSPTTLLYRRFEDKTMEGGCDAKDLVMISRDHEEDNKEECGFFRSFLGWC